MPHRTLSAAEVADYLHLSRADLDRLVKDGAIPCERRGGRLVFQGQEIDSWASQRLLGFSPKRLQEHHQKWARNPAAQLSQRAFLADLLPPHHISAALGAKTKASVLRAMAALAERTGLLYDAGELIVSLQAREALCSTAIPGGIALLHPRALRAQRTSDSFLVLGRTLQPIHFGSPDRQPTDVFFLVCCQEEKLHLHTLARLCLLAQKTDLVTQLRTASDATAMHEHVLAAEQQAVGTLLPTMRE